MSLVVIHHPTSYYIFHSYARHLGNQLLYSESNKALAINKIWSEINVCLLPEAVTNFVENYGTRVIATERGRGKVDVKFC